MPRKKQYASSEIADALEKIANQVESRDLALATNPVLYELVEPLSQRGYKVAILARIAYVAGFESTAAPGQPHNAIVETMMASGRSEPPVIDSEVDSRTLRDMAAQVRSEN